MKVLNLSKDIVEKAGQMSWKFFSSLLHYADLYHYVFNFKDNFPTLSCYLNNLLNYN